MKVVVVSVVVAMVMVLVVVVMLVVMAMMVAVVVVVLVVMVPVVMALIMVVKFTTINPLNAELNPICHLLALLEAHHILHVSRIRVKSTFNFFMHAIAICQCRS